MPKINGPGSLNVNWQMENMQTFCFWPYADTLRLQNMCLKIHDCGLSWLCKLSATLCLTFTFLMSFAFGPK